MSRVLALTNQKGGVGKTTTGINVAASLARAGRKVLLIDLDSQANATAGIGFVPYSADSGIYEVLIGRVSLESVIQSTESGMDAVIASRDLVGAQVELLNFDQREYRLKNAIKAVRDTYNYILMDCPPSLNIVTLNALVAADGVIIPTQCEYFALQGLVELLDTIETVRQSLNPQLKLDGILRTMHDRRNKLNREVSAQLISHFQDLVYRTIIPRNIRLAEAPSHGKTALDYDNKCLGTMAYIAFTGELLSKEERL